MFNNYYRYCAHPSQIMKWSRSLMRVKTGSVRSMDSNTNRVTSVQGSGAGPRSYSGRVLQRRGCSASG